MLVREEESIGGRSYPWTPTRPSGDPADLCVTDGAAQPIAALLFLHNDAALGAVHGLSRPHQSLIWREAEREEEEEREREEGRERQIYTERMRKRKRDVSKKRHDRVVLMLVNI